MNDVDLKNFFTELEKINGIEKVERVSQLPAPAYDILVIKYHPEDSQTIVSFGLSLENYTCSGPILRKMWCDQELKPSSGPAPYNDYRQFEHNGATFHPYSVNLDGYKFSAASIACLLSELYEYTKP